jgi:hypothetical protein
MSSSFARDMRAVRRDQCARWRSEREDPDKVEMLRLHRDALRRFRDAGATTCPIQREQNWAYVVTSIIDSTAAPSSAVASFLQARDMPDLTKSDRRITRRVGLDWEKR